MTKWSVCSSGEGILEVKREVIVVESREVTLAGAVDKRNTQVKAENCLYSSNELASQIKNTKPLRKA